MYMLSARCHIILQIFVLCFLVKKINCHDTHFSKSLCKIHEDSETGDKKSYKHCNAYTEGKPVFLTKNQSGYDFDEDSLEIDDEEKSLDKNDEYFDFLDADDSPEELSLEKEEMEFVSKKDDETREELGDQNPQLKLLMDELVNLSISLRDITRQIEKY